MNPRLRGSGVDIDAALVDRSNERARAEGFADRVRFEHRKRYLHVWAADGRISAGILKRRYALLSCNDS
jgi:hypothetical protein